MPLFTWPGLLVSWIFIVFSRFHWFLLGFTVFYRVLLSFTGFYWVHAPSSSFFNLWNINDTLSCDTWCLVLFFFSLKMERWVEYSTMERCQVSAFEREVPFSVTMASVWPLPKRWMCSTASASPATTSTVHSRPLYSVLSDLAAGGPNVSAFDKVGPA